MIEASLEAAGEIRNLEIAAFLGEPVAAFELPLKLHLQGAGLGSACYIGSDSEPIVLAPKVSAPGAFQIGEDPNGFNVTVLDLEGASLGDDSFTVPGASGCGDGSLDAAIGSLVGLPAPEGASNALLADVSIEFAFTESDGTPPDGGAELQAAFDAAK